MGVQGRYSWRNGQMKLVQIHIIATPGEWLAVGGKYHASYIHGWSCGHVRARDPLRRRQRQRPSAHLQVHVSVIQFARRVGEVSSDLNWLVAGLPQCRSHRGEERERCSDGNCSKICTKNCLPFGMHRTPSLELISLNAR